MGNIRTRRHGTISLLALIVATMSLNGVRSKADSCADTSNIVAVKPFYSACSNYRIVSLPDGATEEGVDYGFGEWDVILTNLSLTKVDTYTELAGIEVHADYIAGFAGKGDPLTADVNGFLRTIGGCAYK